MMLIPGHVGDRQGEARSNIWDVEMTWGHRIDRTRRIIDATVFVLGRSVQYRQFARS